VKSGKDPAKRKVPALFFVSVIRRRLSAFKKAGRSRPIRCRFGSAEVSKPLASVLIGGIVSSTLLTLLGWPSTDCP
jgi:hypothetical protein